MQRREQQGRDGKIDRAHRQQTPRLGLAEFGDARIDFRFELRQALVHLAESFVHLRFRDCADRIRSRFDVGVLLSQLRGIEARAAVGSPLSAVGCGSDSHGRETGTALESIRCD
ncbi:MAG: hypothetical protein F4234_06035 [Gammaproteobacteria bacterium]|nr:hypothetical protein [Gammaproteobacteria bacterium]